ncbi:very-long-chain 3-oxoacyl-CoA synthase [Powellomyces hirtus]|uniref:Elongation of fatty acids protein n=1 Tax=Powellomyces hirtus TaxID=109895 RepID=A0A507E522_9FUNG|nr:very-long-chain 3-oxoacyl-CoA synthase [Powellomyces hirtus]
MAAMLASIPRPEDVFISLGRSLGKWTDPYLAPVEDHLISAAQQYFPTQASAVQTWLSTSRSVHSQKLPLQDPFHVALIIAGYLVMVFGGKKLMRNANKFQVKGLMLLHNAGLAALSAYMCLATLKEAYDQNYRLVGNLADESKQGWPMAKLMWLFYISKTIEFVDTLIMVLKKNDRQISFLHLYHHGSIFAVWWLVVLKAPTGESYFSAALNSFIHVVMYGYYLCMAVGIRQVSFIKRYITAMQMTQFCCMMAQAIGVIYYTRVNQQQHDPKDKEHKPYPADLGVLLFFYMWTMLGLFANFFIQDAKRAKAARIAAKNAKKQ